MSDEKYIENGERSYRDRGMDPQMEGRDGEGGRGGKGKLFFKKKVCRFCTQKQNAQKLKIDYLKSRNPRLHTDEVLIALSASAASSELAKLAIEQLPKLSGCQAHTSVTLSNVDIKTMGKLGVQLTSEAVYETNQMFHN